MKYEFILPRSFQPADFLPLKLSVRADDARWLVSQIVRKLANRDVDAWGCVRLHSDVLRRVMYRPTEPAVIEALEAAGAIETAPYYAGVKAKGFRLAKRFLGDRCVRVMATDPRLIARIQAERERQQDEQRTRWLPVHYALDAEQLHLSVTADADELLDGLPDHTRLCQDVLVERIRRLERPFSVSSTGRVFNSITGLKGSLRPALRMHGEPMGSVDIRCAQPALLAMMLQPEFQTYGGLRLSTYKHATPVAPPLLPSPCAALTSEADVRSFSDLASSGLLYESLVTDTGLERDVVKLSLLRDVLAKRGRYPSAVEEAFQNAFPSVLKIIRTVNHDDHGELIRLLQRAESWLVVETVAPRLLGRIPIMTLHDAIFSRVDGLDFVKGAFAEVFKELGFQLSLKREGQAA